VVLLAGAIGVALFCRSRHEGADTSRKKESTVAAPATSDGLPRTLEELNRSYAEPPTGQNAAAFFQQGFDALRITEADRNSPNLPLIGKGAMPLPGRAVPLAMKSAISGFLQRNQAATQLFEQGAKCSQSRYPIDLTRGSLTPLPHLAKVKHAAQVSVLSALAAVETGPADRVAQGVLLALATARSLDGEPLFISQLVRVSCVSLAAEGLEQAVNRAALPAESLDRLQQAFEKAEEREAAGEGFSSAIVGERVGALTLFDTPPEKLLQQLSDPKTVMPPAEHEKQLARLKNGKDMKAGKQFCLAAFDQVLAARKEPFPARLKAGQAFRQRVVEAKEKQILFVPMLLPALADTAKEAASLAQLRLALTALALERFRSAHDSHYPNALSELVPACIAAVPSDPFDGQPLRYRKQDGGYLLYSVGPDLKDDNPTRVADGKGVLVFAVDRRTPPRTSPARF
jgi:hypothetical protein